MNILQRAGQLHSIASRYVELVRNLQLKLETFCSRRPVAHVPQVDTTDVSVEVPIYQQSFESAAITSSDSVCPPFDTARVPVDIGNDFFDLENLFDSSWFDML